MHTLIKQTLNEAILVIDLIYKDFRTCGFIFPFNTGIYFTGINMYRAFMYNQIWMLNVTPPLLHSHSTPTTNEPSVTHTLIQVDPEQKKSKEPPL